MLQIRNSKSKTFPCRRIRNSIRKELSASAEIKTDEIKTQNMKIIRLLGKYNTEKENLDTVIEEFKQQVSAKTQRLLRYRKRQNQYYQNKMFRTDCKLISEPSQTDNINVKNPPTKKQ